MDYIMDLIIIAIVAITVLFSAKRGFVRIFIETVGLVLAFWLAFTLNGPLADMTYDKMIEPAVVSGVSQVADSTAEHTSDSVWESLPQVFKTGMATLGISKQSLDKTISDHIGSGVENAVQNASQNVIKPAVTRLLGLVYAALLLAVLFLAVKLLARIVNRLFSFHLVGKANRILGGLVGIPKGMVIAVLFCLLVSLAVSFHQGGVWIFTKETLQHSWFINHIPVIDFFT